MAIPKIKEQDIIDALKYIDENGVPSRSQSKQYELVTEDGKKYPPKYVIAVADHIGNGVEISTGGFNAVEAKRYLQRLDYNIETKQEKFELIITAESVDSTDERFTMDNLSLGDDYKPLGAYFRKANGEEIKRTYSKGERRNSNKTLPRIACQISAEQKKQVEFVQFHPSYDYSDFVEGLRPKVNDDGSMGFELQDGVFKKFVSRARKNYEDSQKPKEVVEQEVMAQDAMDSFFADIELGEDKFKTTRGSEFLITGIDEKHIDISIPRNESVNKLRLSVDEIRSMLEDIRRTVFCYRSGIQR